MRAPKLLITVLLVVGLTGCAAATHNDKSSSASAPAAKTSTFPMVNEDLNTTEDEPKLKAQDISAAFGIEFTRYAESIPEPNNAESRLIQFRGDDFDVCVLQAWFGTGGKLRAWQLPMEPIAGAMVQPDNPVTPEEPSALAFKPMKGEQLIYRVPGTLIRIYICRGTPPAGAKDKLLILAQTAQVRL